MSVAPQQFFSHIREDSDSDGPVRVGVTVARPNNINNNNSKDAYQARPEPVNSGERYMREHYNNGEPVPEVLDKSCCGIMKRHKFRAILIAFICTIVLLIVAGTVLYVLL